MRKKEVILLDVFPGDFKRLHLGFLEGHTCKAQNHPVSRLAGKFAVASLNSHLFQDPPPASNLSKEKVFTSSLLFKAAHSIFETVWFLESPSVH